MLRLCVCTLRPLRLNLYSLCQDLYLNFRARLIVCEIFSRDGKAVAARRQPRRDTKSPDVRLLSARPEELDGLCAVHPRHESRRIAVGADAYEKLIARPDGLRSERRLKSRRMAVNDEAFLFLVAVAVFIRQQQAAAICPVYYP